MILKRITIQGRGGLAPLTYDLKDGVNVVKSRHTEELVLAIKLLLGHSPPFLQTPICEAGAIIEALVTVDGKEYFLTVKDLCLSARDEEGNDKTQEYRYLCAHSPEQDASDIFRGDATKTLFRLIEYLDEDNYYAKNELSRRTERLSDTKTFRAYLRRFIKESTPETIHEGKGYELVLREGTYHVQYKGENVRPVYLSESEQTLFRYLCFLKTAEFWCGFEALRNLHSVQKPLLIENFLERLDESIDVRGLFKKAEGLGRQIIILSA